MRLVFESEFSAEGFGSGSGHVRHFRFCVHSVFAKRGAQRIGSGSLRAGAGRWSLGGSRFFRGVRFGPMAVPIRHTLSATCSKHSSGFGGRLLNKRRAELGANCCTRVIGIVPIAQPRPEAFAPGSLRALKIVPPAGIFCPDILAIGNVVFRPFGAWALSVALT